MPPLAKPPAAGGTAALPTLAACCFLLSALEYLIPKPVPFMRLGLANLPLVLAAAALPPGPFMLLALLKAAGGALITGTLFSYVFLFSLAGALSAPAMYLLRRAAPRRLGFIGLSAAGALVSNAAQLALARAFPAAPPHWSPPWTGFCYAPILALD